MSNAFAGCTSLKYFKLPEGITNLGGYIISLCMEVEELHLPKIPLIMTNFTFANCQVKHLYAYEERPHKINTLLLTIGAILQLLWKWIIKLALMLLKPLNL